MNDGIIIIHLLMYLQNMIDSGQHKLFYNDLMHDEKVIDIINAITNLQEENEDYKSRCEKATELIEKSRVKATPFFKQFDGDLIMPKREVDKLLNSLNGGDEE